MTTRTCSNWISCSIFLFCFCIFCFFLIRSSVIGGWSSSLFVLDFFLICSWARSAPKPSSIFSLFCYSTAVQHFLDFFPSCPLCVEEEVWGGFFHFLSSIFCQQWCILVATIQQQGGPKTSYGGFSSIIQHRHQKLFSFTIFPKSDVVWCPERTKSDQFPILDMLGLLEQGLAFVLLFFAYCITTEHHQMESYLVDINVTSVAKRLQPRFSCVAVE